MRLWVETQNLPSPNFLWQVSWNGQVVSENRGQATLELVPDRVGAYEITVKIVE
ncbi:MAG: hypothetical protein R3264_12055 [Anaerolineae bacterium]|nr:hypothetical protein [Anaerolineae bacterium]